jgi:recombination protein RecA
MPNRPDDEVWKIREKLGHLAVQPAPAQWLDTGIPDLNQVLGDRQRGIAYGRIIEASGWESHAKTSVFLSILALAQRDGAELILADFENSYDPAWAERRGIDVSRLRVFQPYVGKFGKEKTPRLCTAQELCAEVEEAIFTLAQRKATKIAVLVDSVPSMLPEGAAIAGLEERTMRTQLELPVFLSSLLQRWVGLAHAYSVMMIFINQLRQKPQAFGDSVYTPGGSALKFYSHVRVRLRRTKGGKIVRKGKVVGIQGVIQNLKNKVGGYEGSSIGFRLLFDGPIEFVPVEELEDNDEQ